MSQIVLVAGIFLLLASSQQIAPLSQSDIDNFLNLHNDARRNTIPQASNMLELKWDTRLQTVAQNYAVKCIWNHNPSRTSDANGAYRYIGENIYYANQANYLATSDALTRAVNAWNDEKQFYNYNGNQCTSVCGHYTQNIWATTQYIGCGIAYCPTMQNVNCVQYGKCSLVVCNYGEG